MKHIEFLKNAKITGPYYAAWRAGTTNRGFIPARQAGSRFLGPLKGLQIRALICMKTAF